MYTIRSITTVDEPDHGFSALRHAKCWAWNHAIVTNKGCFAEIGIYLGFQRLDFDLIVVYRWAFFERKGPATPCQYSTNMEDQTSTYFSGAFTGGIGSGNS